jgi:hypothetical protein
VYTYNTSPPEDDLSRAQSELAQVKDIMVQNVEQILSRGERIELLVDKTDNMASQATTFRRGARTVQRQMWRKNKRVLGLGVLVALVRMPRFSPLLICTLLDPVHSSQVIPSLGDYGRVLWRGAMLWSQVSLSEGCSSPAACTRFDLISIVISFNSNVSPYSIAICSPVTPYRHPFAFRLAPRSPIH